MDKKLSFISLAPHLKNLHVCGIYQLNPHSPKLHKLFHSIYMKIILILLLLFMVQQILKIYQVRNDANKVMNTMFLLLTHSDSIYKQMILWIKADKIEEILEIMKGPIFNQDSTHHQEHLSQTVMQARLLLRAFNNAALSTCLLWVLYPVILYAQGKSVEFAIWLPFDANTSPNFYIVVIYVWIQTSWVAFSNTTMDAFISFFLAQCKTQLSILRLELENVAEKSKEEASRLSRPLSVVLQERFTRIMIYYDEIIKFHGKVQEVFGGVIFYLFFVSGWIICTTAYRTVNINPASMEFVSMIMYMCCVLTELILYCYFGNEVNFETQPHLLHGRRRWMRNDAGIDTVFEIEPNATTARAYIGQTWGMAQAIPGRRGRSTLLASVQPGLVDSHDVNVETFHGHEELIMTRTKRSSV
ncbi:odorant receptor Or1-like [Hyposmocoma kahamanoa]|uniref:odorant receptor Or1-like n=1 Tax=Hyposmocoma kahamanoa TaxID=1477025 RepID=UPI000E6D81A4|nr:odorant receptor Or1-like [Hyposmocoma kahamanoa]